MPSYLLPLHTDWTLMYDRNQTLQSYTGWLHTVARNMTDISRADDLAQEGYIAMWRAMSTHNPDRCPLDWWLKTNALNRMRTISAGGSFTTNQGRKTITGFTTKQGNTTRERIQTYISDNPKASGVEVAKALDLSQATVSYHRSKMGTVSASQSLTEETVSMDAMLDGGWELEGSNYLDDFVFAYHAGEIYEALDVLTPAQRKYVIERFYHSRTVSELIEIFGYDPTSMWVHIKPKLQLRLGNLRELVGVS